MIIQPSQKYFMIDNYKTEIIPMDNNDLENCLKKSKDVLICTPYSPMYKKDRCISSLFTSKKSEDIFHNCKNYFVKLPIENYFVQINDNHYFCFINFPILIRYSCAGREIEDFIIKNNGILYIENECYITGKEMKIVANSEMDLGNKLVLDTPKFNSFDMKSILNNITKYELDFDKYDNGSNNDIFLLKQEKYIELYKQAENIAQQRQKFAFDHITSIPNTLGSSYFLESIQS